MKTKIVVSVVGLLVVIFGVLAVMKTMQIRTLIAAGKSMTMPPETVTTTEVREDSWEPVLTAVGSVTAVQGVTLSAELGGTVTHIAFESGANVKAGDLLVELDTSAEKAQLKAAEAAAALASTNFKRAKDLRENNTNSQADLDTADAQAKDAEAQLENIRATLAKKTIRAPFTGRVGIRQINLGQFIGSGTPIVSLQSLDPIYVDFWMPQQQLGQLATGLTVRAISDAFPGKAFTGKLTAINPDVDSATRNVKVQATFANGEGVLRPGLFANVVVALPRTDPVLAIPATSVLYAPYGDTVYVVQEKKDEATGQAIKVVRQQFVRLGVTKGDFVAVTSGLKVGETIVTNGAFKLRNGSHITVNNEISPKAELAPKPSDS